MKIQTIVIGNYSSSPDRSFCIYQFPTHLPTPPCSLTHDANEQRVRKLHYFCIDDIFTLFDFPTLQHDLIATFKYYPAIFFKDQEGRSYLQSQAVSDIALKHKAYALVDLCRLSEHELLTGGAIPLLKAKETLHLFSSPSLVPLEFTPRRLSGDEWFLNAIKEEPNSPVFPSRITPSQSRSPQRCLSSDTLSNNTALPFEQSLPMSQSEFITTLPPPKPSSLLVKRLAPKHGHKNLTILTPSYNEQAAVAIQSAPLRTMPSIHRVKPNKIVKKTKSGHLQSLGSKLVATPTTANMASTPWPKTCIQARFPSPPIVPSQQPSWGQYHRQQHHHHAVPAKTATGATFPRTPITATVTPPTPTLLTQKQKFLQPFEHLYDNIEQTRTLKSTLDDQIRRSSSLIQTLQSSGTMVEGLVRRQVRDMVDQSFESRLRECHERITRLENQQEQDVLNQLLNRLDRLETKLNKRASH
ncbi:hypothetical protein K501DRAFT_334934 [Backusella circina FSU 941]|nr:hypothetical protein K501DRAFT_334934 [Backusella circina FSU 941]